MTILTMFLKFFSSIFAWFFPPEREEIQEELQDITDDLAACDIKIQEIERGVAENLSDEEELAYWEKEQK